MPVMIYSKPAVRNAWADTAVPTTDIVDPGNAIVTAGWLQTSQPPPRQHFNWLLNWSAGAVRYFMQHGISTWDVGETYSIGSLVIATGANTLFQSIVNNNTGNSPVVSGSSPAATAFWAKLNGYTIDSQLTAYVTQTSLTSQLASYVTNASLASQLANYVTNSSLASTLASYVTNASLASTLSSYLTIASAAINYLTIANAASTYATLISPHLSGTPTAPTAAAGTVNTQIATTQFAVGTGATTSSSGWYQLPNGIIEQFGYVTNSTGGPVTVPFPVAFPNFCVSITATPSPSNGTVNVSNPANSNTGFTLTNGAAGDNTCWRAVGR